MNKAIYRHLRPRDEVHTYRNDEGDLIRVSYFSVYMNLNRVPSKAKGRKGTRRAWKRAHPPGFGSLHRYFDDAARMSVSG